MPNGEETISGRDEKAIVTVKPGYVYYLKLWLVPVPIWGCFLATMPHEEGASLIMSYKLNQVK